MPLYLRSVFSICMKSKILLSFFAILLMIQPPLLGQSFKTSKLKDNEIFNFFESSVLPDKKEKQLKLEDPSSVVASLISNSDTSSADFALALPVLSEGRQIKIDKSKIHYFELERPNLSYYNSELKKIEIGNTEDYNAIAKYFRLSVTNPVVIEKVFQPFAKNKRKIFSDSSQIVNELVIFLNIINKDDAFNSIFSKGIFSVRALNDVTVKKDLYDCTFILGVKIAKQDELVLSSEKIGDGKFAEYNLFHFGIKCYLKKIIVVNSAEKKIISDINIE